MRVELNTIDLPPVERWLQPTFVPQLVSWLLTFERSTATYQAPELQGVLIYQEGIEWGK